MRYCMVPALCLILHALPASAEVEGVTITTRAAVAAGKVFGDSGSYEKLVGRISFALDPSEPHNAQIVDLAYARRDKDGLVRFSSDLYVLRPSDPAKGNGVLLFEIANRGRLGMLGRFNAGGGGNDPTTAADFGDGLLMREGYTLVWVGWEVDAPAPLLRVDAPVAALPPSAKVDPISADIMVNVRTNETFLIDDPAGRPPVIYPPNDLANASDTLIVRNNFWEPGAAIPRERWRFVADATGLPRIQLEGGFEPGRYYKVTYQATGALVARRRERRATTRLAHCSWSTAPPSSQLRTPSALIGTQRLTLKPISCRRRAVAGADSSERALYELRALRHVHGEDVLGRDSFAGLRTSSRRARTARRPGFPRAVPRFLPSEPPVAGAGGSPADRSGGEQLNNPTPQANVMRALLRALHRWEAEGTPPPSSRVPRLSDGTLVPITAAKFPTIPGVSDPRLITGPARRIAGRVVPLPHLVPQVDSDGNDLAGVRDPEIAVPLATTTGWNFRAASVGNPADIYQLLGSVHSIRRDAGEARGRPGSTVVDRRAVPRS